MGCRVPREVFFGRAQMLGSRVWLRFLSDTHVAVGQSQWCHFGVGAPPILVYFSGDWDVDWDWGYGLLTYGQVSS